MEYNDGAPHHSDVMDLPWHDELCCDSPYHTVGVGATHTSQTNNSGACLPPDGCCSFRNMTTESHPRLLSGGKSLFTDAHNEEVIHSRLLKCPLVFAERIHGPVFTAVLTSLELQVQPNRNYYCVRNCRRAPGELQLQVRGRRQLKIYPHIQNEAKE